MNDYLEVPLYLEQDETVTLYVTLRDKSMIAFKGVYQNPVCYDGVWNISHEFHTRKATSILVADQIAYFTKVEDETY